jgi:uncharacterized protein (DUF2267 family)
MSATGLDVFDRTLQTTHIWLDELMESEAIGPDRSLAWHVLGAVLRAIRDRMPVDLAAHLGSQLPILVRGAYYDQFRPADMPERTRALDQFLQRIAGELAMSRPVNIREATRAVFQLLSRHVDRGQIEKVRNAMPEHIRAIWYLDSEAPGGPERTRQRGDRDAA